MQSSEPVIYDWSRVVHKGVRTKDGHPVGSIAAVDDENMTILAPRSRVYSIPKSSVEEFNGSEVRLNLVLADIGNYVK